MQGTIYLLVAFKKISHVVDALLKKCKRYTSQAGSNLGVFSRSIYYPTVYMLRNYIVYNYFMPLRETIKTIARGAVNDPIHYRSRPSGLVR